jgi:hypothetical protein
MIDTTPERAQKRLRRHISLPRNGLAPADSANKGPYVSQRARQRGVSRSYPDSSARLQQFLFDTKLSPVLHEVALAVEA